MEKVLSWLKQPLSSGSVLQIWMVAAAGLVLVLAVIYLVIRSRKRKQRGKKRLSAEKTTVSFQENENSDITRQNDTTDTPLEEQKFRTTEKPMSLPVLELANLQGLGNREEQQDAFGISRMENYERDGLLAVLCDGMGGMAEGGRIAGELVSQLLAAFPWEDNHGVPGWIRSYSRTVFRQFRGHGGTTLVAALICQGQLSFWCVGDSDLFLLRDEKLYALNRRQEYKNDLILRALEGAFPIEEAFLDRQAGALSEYVGKEEVNSDYTRIPFALQSGDALLLCSDGVSDTLTLKQIREALVLSPQLCCDKLETEIRVAEKPNQDNYTAIAMKYHGKKEEAE